MLTVEVEFLAGRYVATSAFNYDESEWPPHPGRLYSALVAAYHEGDYGSAEREALLWLESLGPPGIQASEATQRETPVCYVPPNDFRKAQAVPALRVQKAPRRFPTMVPDDNLVRFVWDEAVSDGAEEKVDALQRLAESVHYLGHSSTPVRVQVLEERQDVDYEPHPDGSIPIRVATEGRLQELEHKHSLGQRPQPSLAANYRRVEPELAEVPSSCFGDFIVFRRTDGPRLPLEGTYKLTSTIRRAVISLAEEPVNPVITGHTADGTPLQRDHLAYVPLANVGHPWGDGAILGFALVLPENIDPESRRDVYRAVERETSDGYVTLDRITLGRPGVLEVEGAPVPKRTTLKPDLYRGAHHLWASVTPMAFDRYPKDKEGETRRGIVNRACSRLGLPEPARVGFSNHSPLVGVPPSSEFVVSTEASFARRPRTHVVLEFSEPVRGPIILGAARYFGLGLMRPCEE